MIALMNGGKVMPPRFTELIAPHGKFRIVGIDRFEPPGMGHFVYADYESLEEAIKIAMQKTYESSGDATSEDVSTVYYVYDDKGAWRGPN